MSGPREALLQRAKQWAHYAEEDLRAARQSLNAEPPLTRIAGFHAQQAAEKYLKALLVRHEIDFPFTHDLAHLLDLCAAWLDDAELDEAIGLNVYAVMMRYPGVAETVSRAEAEQAVKLAAHVSDVVRDRLITDGVDLNG